MRVGLGLALLTAVTLSAAARAAVVEEFKAEDWDGLAFTSDETGDFTHCSVYASYKNGSTLYISYEVGDTWFFSVANDSWTLKEGGNFDIKFKVDRRGEIEGTGTALGPTQIGLPVEADHAFVGQLRRGNRLVITFQTEDYAFELSNSNKAMNAAQDCVRRHVRLGTKTPVVTSSSDEPVPQESQQAEQQPAEDDASGADASTDMPAEAAGEQQTFGPWVVTAADDGNGNFVNCTAYGVQGDDQIILSYFPDGVWTFGLYRAAWSLDTNQTYYFWYNVDGPADAEGVVKRPVEAAEPTRIFFEVSDVEDIIDRIENGETLNIQFRGVSGAAETYSYGLDQAHAAFEATRKCVTDRAGGGLQGEPVSKEGTGVKQDDTGAGSNADTAEKPTNKTLSDQEMAGIPELGSKQIESMKVPGWEAAAFSLDDGTFTHCGIKAEYQNGATLGFARATNGDLILAIQHQDWSLEAGSRVPITYDLTGSEPLSITADSYALTANLILSNMENESSVTETLRNAPQMTIEGEGKSLSFDISDVGPGVTAIDECVARHLAEPHLPAPKKPAAK